MNPGHPNLPYRRRKANANLSQNGPNHWADRWLPRLSHFSQFGLFLFTIGTIYFTVIPLYQKALLEEAIAKKEVDFKQASEALVAMETGLQIAQRELAINNLALLETKKALAQAELKTYVQKRSHEIFGFIFSSGAGCTGLLIRPKPLSMDAEKGPEPHEDFFGLKPDQCLLAEFQKSRLKALLHPKDLEFINAEISKRIVVLQELKARARRVSDELPVAARNDPSLLISADGFEARMQDFLSRARIINPLPPEEKRRQEFQRAITRTRNDVAHKYMDDCRKVIQELGELKSWPIALQAS